MNTHADKNQENKSQAVSAVDSQMQRSESTFQFVDNRPEAIAQRRLQEIANRSTKVKQLITLQKKADKYAKNKLNNSTIQLAESDIPTGVKVNFLARNYKTPNFKLTVINVRQKNGEDIGGTLPANGQVKESVENDGNLKGDTQHSSWSNKASMMDSHSIPRSLLCGGSTGNRFFKAGETIASQLFLYKDDEVAETVIPNSGFEIRYTNNVFAADGTPINEYGKVDAEDGMYSVFEMEKRPSPVIANDYGTYEGSGGTGVIRWKIEQPDPGTLIWKVTVL